MSVVSSRILNEELNYHAISNSKLYINVRNLEDEETLFKRLGLWELPFDYNYFDVYTDRTFVTYPLWGILPSHISDGYIYLPFFFYAHTRKINIICVSHRDYGTYDNEDVLEYG